MNKKYIKPAVQVITTADAPLMQTNSSLKKVPTKETPTESNVIFQSKDSEFDDSEWDD